MQLFQLMPGLYRSPVLHHSSVTGDHANENTTQMRPRGTPTSCTGFTIVELIVCLAAITTLVAISLPAVQAARESSRMLRCSNNQTQIGLDAQLHLSHHRCFPSNGGYDEGHSYRSLGNLTTPPVTIDYERGSMYRWGIGLPGVEPNQQIGSFFYAIMPYVGLYDP